MENYYRGTKEKPYHLSVGAVLVNDNNEVCCHYFEKFEYKPDLVQLEDNFTEDRPWEFLPKKGT